MAEQSWQEAAAEVWQLFRETDARFKETEAGFKEVEARFKETDARFKETDAKFEEMWTELNRLFAETDARFKETDAKFERSRAARDAEFRKSREEWNARFEKSRAEWDAKFEKSREEWNARFDESRAEWDRRSKEHDQSLRRLEGMFGSQWGRLMESLVQPGALKLFQRRGIEVRHIFPRAKSQRNGRMMELDLLLENGQKVVVIEVKTTLKVGDVQDFLADLAELFDFFPRYRTYKVYAGVAGMEIVEDADRYAYRQGLFVLSVGGEGTVQIRNDAQFKPKDFAQS